MGLDTSWYRGLKKREDVTFDGNGEPTNVERYFRPYINRYFPGREKPLEHRAVYEYEASGREGIHMPYSTYNRWREWLASLVGTTPRRVWRGEDQPQAFADLINFSDCEGVIGAEAAARLAKDFAEWDERAKAAAADEWDYKIYKDMRFAFEQAAQGGAVDFH